MLCDTIKHHRTHKGLGRSCPRGRKSRNRIVEFRQIGTDALDVRNDRIRIARFEDNGGADDGNGEQDREQPEEHHFRSKSKLQGCGS